MYVLVTHDIADPEGFARAEDKAEVDIEANGWPEGITDCPITLYNPPRTFEVCLFEAESIPTVRQFVESILGPPLSENSYVEIVAGTVPSQIGDMRQEA
jgi:hypothetical protein